MRNYWTRILLITFVCGAVGNPALAQRRGPRGRVYTRNEVNELIKRAEDRSDRFVKLFDKALDKSAFDGTKREDRLNERAKDLEKAMDNLRHEFDRKESYVETKPEMVRVLNIASGINRVMLNRRLRGDAEEAWTALRGELNILASVYYLPGLRLPEPWERTHPACFQRSVPLFRTSRVFTIFESVPHLRQAGCLRSQGATGDTRRCCDWQSGRSAIGIPPK